jgi:hypothetical protein
VSGKRYLARRGEDAQLRPFDVVHEYGLAEVELFGDCLTASVVHAGGIEDNAEGIAVITRFIGENSDDVDFGHAGSIAHV